MGNEKNKVVAGEICPNDLSRIREAVCVQVEKIYDYCREKDCIENARVLFKDTPCNRYIINNAINVKCRNAEVVDVFADIEPVPFKRGFFTVDVKFFIRVTLDFFLPNGMGPGGTEIRTRKGLVLFDKKVILFGSEGNVKIFKSQFIEDGIDKPIRSRLQQDNRPISKIEVAEPICLGAQIQDIHDKCFESCCIDSMSRDLADLIGDDNDNDIQGIDERSEGVLDTSRRRVVATIGLFSIIKLIRFVQLLIPAFDFCVPNRECIAATEENPCDLFDTIEFPVDEFFPPQIFDFPGAAEEEHKMRSQSDA